MTSRRGDSYLFCPVARNLPYIRIRTGKPPEELTDKRIVVHTSLNMLMYPIL